MMLAQATTREERGDRTYPTGNRTGRVQDGVAVTWTYDDIYRLTGQQKSGEAATFSYDAAGNILLKWQQGTSPMSVTYDAANRLVTMLQGALLTTYTFDATGNLTEENAAGSRTSYVYDNENRLTRVLFADATRSTYTYAADGLRRSAFEAGGTLVTFVWDADDYLMDKGGGATVRYTAIQSEVVAENRAGTRRLYLPDPTRSTVALLDNSQAKTDTFSYWPYGEEASRTGTTPTPFRFVGAWGYYRDSANRTYVRARELRPDMARWMTADQIGRLAVSCYGYVRGRPLRFVDPSGLEGITPMPPRTPPPWLPGLGCPPAPPTECFWCVYRRLHTRWGTLPDVGACAAAEQMCSWNGPMFQRPECPPREDRPPAPPIPIEPPGAVVGPCPPWMPPPPTGPYCTGMEDLDCGWRCFLRSGNKAHICKGGHCKCVMVGLRPWWGGFTPPYRVRPVEPGERPIEEEPPKDEEPPFNEDPYVPRVRFPIRR